MKMKKKLWKNESLTLLLIRSADQSVKQIKATKLWFLTFLILGLLLIVTLASGVIFLTISNHHLTTEKKNTELVLEEHQRSIQGRDQNIQMLESQLLTLTANAEEMKSKMKEVTELEQKLKSFISNYQDKNNSVQTKSIPDGERMDTSSQFTGMGGEYIAMSEDQAIQLAQQTNQSLEVMKKELDQLDTQILDTIEKAKDAQEQIAHTPSFWPTQSIRITSNFGYRKDPIRHRVAYHSGLDIGGDYRDPIYAAADGKVIDTGRNRTDGNYILIQHSTGIKTKYMHLSSIGVKEKQTVKKGEQIGRMGSTGRSTGTHLHFEVWLKNQPVDPLMYVHN